jgi:hypothetical protein
LPLHATGFNDGVLRSARTHRVPIFFLGSDATISVPDACADCDVALCNGGSEFLDGVMATLAALPRRETGHANAAQSVQLPTLVTDRPSIAVCRSLTTREPRRTTSSATASRKI